MNRFVVAEPLWCTGCIPVSLPVRTCIKRKVYSNTRAWPWRRRQHSLPLSCVITVRKPLACRSARSMPSPRGMMRSNSTKASVLAASFCAVVCPFGAISASGSRPVNAPAQYVFQAEGSLKDGEENAPTQHALLRWEPGVQTVAVKCDLCDFLPEGPACVRACPNQALRLITDDSLQRQMKEKQRLAASWFANGGEDPLSLTQEQR